MKHNVSSLSALKTFKTSFNGQLREIMQLDQKPVIVSAINDCASDLEQHEKQFTLIVSKIPPYERRVSQSILATLRESLARVRHAKLPRPRFRFSSRKLLQKQQEQHEAAPTALPSIPGLLFQAQHGQTLIADPDNMPLSSGGAFVIRDLTDCTVIVPYKSAAIKLEKCVRCFIVCAPVGGAVHIDELAHCELVLACHQLRVHDSTHLRASLRVGSKPIIEGCSEVVAGGIGTGPDGWSGLLTDQRLLGGSSRDLWMDIQDFSWHQPDQQSPHWCIDQTIVEPMLSKLARLHKW
eukprot:gnl/Dysnectes_brevis/7847_a13561_207.p1 GENE.gnl/Dysnectes_brevis/7847_a13561_207~~gnl/Dysnectes_brevis/7847_a13561_207.p1  ORF type:complete len:294 (-),score=55.71 gnl/Dysnectes_brevis/7847_a13561_207:21-902(-)